MPHKLYRHLKFTLQAFQIKIGRDTLSKLMGEQEMSPLEKNIFTSQQTLNTISMPCHKAPTKYVFSMLEFSVSVKFISSLNVLFRRT